MEPAVLFLPLRLSLEPRAFRRLHDSQRSSMLRVVFEPALAHRDDVVELEPLAGATVHTAASVAATHLLTPARRPAVRDRVLS